MSWCVPKDVEELCSNEKEMYRLTKDYPNVVIDAINITAGTISLYINAEGVADETARYMNAGLSLHLLFRKHNKEVPIAVKEMYNEIMNMLSDLKYKKIRDETGNKKSPDPIQSTSIRNSCVPYQNYF